MIKKTMSPAKLLICVILVSLSTLQDVRSSQDEGSISIAAASMVHLLSDPKFFVDRKVRVFGYVYGIGASTLYLTKAHAEAQDAMSSLSLSTAPLVGEAFGGSKCVGHYAYVIGEVKVEPFIPYSLVKLVNVESITVTDGPEGDNFQTCYEAQP